MKHQQWHKQKPSWSHGLSHVEYCMDTKCKWEPDEQIKAQLYQFTSSVIEHLNANPDSLTRLDSYEQWKNLFNKTAISFGVDLEACRDKAYDLYDETVLKEAWDIMTGKDHTIDSSLIRY